MQHTSRLLKEEVTEEDIAKIVSTWTGIPVSRLQEGERAKLVKMEERLMERVVGQQQAIKAVSNAVRRARAGLQDENRPIGSFLFLGPTGVGKTELSKALAEFLGLLDRDERAGRRIDPTMNEVGCHDERHSRSDEVIPFRVNGTVIAVERTLKDAPIHKFADRRCLPLTRHSQAPAGWP
jgi:hypothetical protein